jgi:outer membrane protein assembly factor BamB
MGVRRAVAAGALAAAVALTGCGHSSTSNGSPSATPAPTSDPTAVADGHTPLPAVTQQASVADNWTTYHRDNARSGVYLGAPAVTKLSTLFDKTLDAAVYAEPLVIDGRLIVATENNTVYAFNAASGALLWRKHLASPVPRSSLPCGNIDPEGITGTPAYDTATKRIFVVAEQRPGVRHMLYGLDVSTGAVGVQRSADPPNQDPTPMQERGALLVVRGRVYWTFGGLAGDCGSYHGHVVSVPTSGTGPMTFYRIPTPREAGIWTPPGPSLGSDGNLYVSAGNGESQTTYDGSDSVVELSPGLTRLSYFAPASWREDNAADLDLGSLGPTLVGKNVFIAGKRGTGYLLRQGALGGVGGQLAAHPVCKAFGGTAHYGANVYVPCTDGVRQVRIGTNDFAVGWKAAANISGSPVFSRGALWALDPAGGALYVLDPATGHVVTSHRTGTTTRFATPTVWRNEVFVGTESGIDVLKVS